MAEREITAAEAWELRFLEEQRRSVVLRLQVASLQAALAKLELRTLTGEQGPHERAYQAVLGRLGVTPGDDLVERDGKFLIVSATAAPPAAPGGKG